MENDGNEKLQQESERRRFRSSGLQTITTCVVCNKVKCKEDTKVHCICENVEAEQQLKNAKFYLDAVFNE